MMHPGSIDRWDDDKGFGFIRPGNGDRPVFVHIKAFGPHSRRPHPGDKVTYRLSEDARGRPRAAKVRYSAYARSPAHKTHPGPIPPAFGALFAIALTALALLGQTSWLFVLVYGAASVITFMTYAWDKFAARTGRWRTQESTLLLLGLACGWPGAIAAQRLCHHKSRKTSFLAVFWVTVVLNLAAFGYLLWTHRNAAAEQLMGRFWHLLS